MVPSLQPMSKIESPADSGYIDSRYLVYEKDD